MINLNRPDLLRRRQRSQSLVEFAFSLIALVMLISGTVDLGRAFFVITAMEDTVGEGAVFLSQNARCVSSEISGCADPNSSIFRMKNAAGGLLAITTVVETPNTTEGNAWFKICWPDDPDNAGLAPATYVECSIVSGASNDLVPGYNYGVGDDIYVEMNYNFRLWSPYIPVIVGSDILTLKVSTTSIVVVK